MGREYRIVHRTNYNWWYAEDMILNTFGFIQLEYLVKHDDIAIQKQVILWIENKRLEIKLSISILDGFIKYHEPLQKKC